MDWFISCQQSSNSSRRPFEAVLRQANESEGVRGMESKTTPAEASESAVNDLSSEAHVYLTQNQNRLRGILEQEWSESDSLQPRTNEIIICFKVQREAFTGHIIAGLHDEFGARHQVFGACIGYGDLDGYQTFDLFGETYYVGTLHGGFRKSLCGFDEQGGTFSLSMMAYTHMTPLIENQSKEKPTARDLAIMTLVCPHLSREWESRKLTAKDEIDMSSTDFIETWQDNREPKLIDQTGVHPCYYHEFARCERCNGEVEFMLPEALRIVKAKAFKCPHCNNSSSIMNEIVNRINGGE